MGQSAEDNLSGHGGIQFSQQGRRDNGLDFAGEVLTELGQVDEMFRLPITKATTVENAMKDLAPEFKYWGVEPLQERATGAERRHLFGLPNDKSSSIKVYERGNQVWVDVSALKNGDGGDKIYNAVADWTFNTGRTFIGDPKGLSIDAMRRRTYHMLGQALKHETTKHFQPSDEQLRGDVARGIVPLKWSDNDADNIKNLIDTFVRTAYNRNKLLNNYEFDFNQRAFRRIAPIGKDVGETRLVPAEDAGGKIAGGREGRAAIWLKSIMGSQGEEQSRLLAKLYRQPLELLEPNRGNGNRVKPLFSENQPAPDAGFSSPKTGNTIAQVKTTIADALGLLGTSFRERLPMVDVVQSIANTSTGGGLKHPAVRHASEREYSKHFNGGGLKQYLGSS